MKKIGVLIFSIALLSACQSSKNLDDDYGYVSAANYSSTRYNNDNNPYWQNSYRLNSGNYYGNRSFARPEMIY